MKKYYIAYGSNLNKEQMKYRCPTAKPLGRGYLKDYRLLFKGSKTGAYLTIEKAEGEIVPVGIWEINEMDEQHLDWYEGYPMFYFKQNMKVDLYDNNDKYIAKLDAMVYIMQTDRHIAIPSQRYVQVCEKGYQDFGLNTKTLEQAYTYSVINKQ